MRTALFHLVSLAWFFAPAWCANMAPPFVRYWRGWNRPVSRRWLGSHKTVVGVLAGVLAGFAATAAQARAHVPFAILADYAAWPWLGLAFGGGAMAGDMLKSFLKRRLGIPPGARWMPFDQVDFAIGALVFASPFADLGLANAIALLALTFAGALVLNRMAFRLGIKRDPW
ncbi:MAG TPA: CDP-archaeol synthase [Rhodanobacteraceae bacterium]|jgi:CDP-2,3-bis-(O-geranylgeranyl)-sn-glycerol synthase